MVSENPFPSLKRSSTPNFCNSISKRIFSDVAGDITIDVDGESFLLHKFPLVSRSGKIRKMIADTKDSDLSKLELVNLPGGSHTFELAVKFCYGTNFEITTANVAHLRCAAEFLEMTEDFREENLIARTETYLNEIVVQSLERSVEVLSTCETLLPIADEVGIITRCVDAIALNASKEQLVSGLSRLDCGNDSGKLKNCGEWWVEDLSILKIDLYQRVICAMRRTGIRPDSIITSLMHFAQSSLKGIGKRQVWEPASDSGESVGNEQRVIVETLISLFPADSVPLAFLFGMLRTAIIVDAAVACRLELERRIGFQLEAVSLDDLLIPSSRAGDSMFDVDTIHRILVHFLQRVEEEDESEEPLGYYGYESDGAGSPPSHGSVLKVGRLIDGYLAEIAPDPYLKLNKFMGVIELLPDYARVVDDGLYRAIDIYLKAHPALTESECKKLCKFIDCQKLSQEASNHAAQNERLPVMVAVRVLYFEQIRLKNSLRGDSGDGFFLSQRISSGVPSTAVSPRDNYASLRRENRELKLEITRMRARLSDLEKEQVCMKQGMAGKSRHGKTLFSSISKGIGRMGIFGPTAEGGTKVGKKGRGSERGKHHGRRRRHSVS